MSSVAVSAAFYDADGSEVETVPFRFGEKVQLPEGASSVQFFLTAIPQEAL